MATRDGKKPKEEEEDVSMGVNALLTDLAAVMPWTWTVRTSHAFCIAIKTAS